MTSPERLPVCVLSVLSTALKWGHPALALLLPGSLGTFILRRLRRSTRRRFPLPLFAPANVAVFRTFERGKKEKRSPFERSENLRAAKRRTLRNPRTAKRRTLRNLRAAQTSNGKTGQRKTSRKKRIPVRRKRQTFDGTESGLRRDVGKDGTESGLRRKRRCFRFRRVFASRRGDGREKPRNALTGRLKGFPARSRKSLSLPRRGSLRSQIEN